ncbi:hypothetical protein MMC17_004206 [Xylographa soralifera]|nr:hypothetical protein [Xylographa soralifera]
MTCLITEPAGHLVKIVSGRPYQEPILSAKIKATARFRKPARLILLMPRYNTLSVELRRVRFSLVQEARRAYLLSQEAVVQKYTSQRMPGTSNWIFNHPSYQAWLDSPGVSCLWISGAAGAGKSILSAAILDNLKKHQQSQSSTYISFFSNTDNGSTDSAREVLRVLICQLIRYQKPPINVSTLLSLLDELERHLQRMPQGSFRQYLRRVFNTLSEKQNIVFVFDDFDSNEWIKPTFIDEIMQTNLHRSKSGYFKCLFTSRSSFVTTESSNQLVSIDMSKEPGVYSDIFHYAVKNVTVLPSISVERSHVLEVSRRLCHRADGIFLWVILALEELQDSCEPLETVENIPHGIEGIYERRLRLITPQDWPVAQKIFSWLAAAYRSLSVSELSEALVIENRNLPSLAPHALDCTKNEQPVSDFEMSRICGSLIRVTEEGIVYFRHSSVRRYILSGGGLVSSRHGAQNSHELVANACLLLLGSHDVENHILLGHDLSQPGGDVQQPTSSLFRYVATYWTAHVRLVERKSRSVNTMLQYLFERALKRLCQERSVPGLSWRTRVMKAGLLQLYAYHGFSSLTQMYLETGVDPNDRSCIYCDTPLNIATAKGNTECVALLLKKGASIEESTHDMEETPLHVACSNGSLSIAKMILRSNPGTCHTTDLFGNTPLLFAAASGTVEMVKLLLDYGADYNAITIATHETPLHLAAGHGHHLAVIALVDGHHALSAEVDVYDSITQQPYFQTWSEDLVQDNEENGPFVWEADARDLADTDMKSLLLSSKQHADPSIRNYEGRTAFQEAALHGHEKVVQVLLDGDDAFTGGKKDQICALQLAAEHGHLSVVRLLLRRGVYNYSGRKEWGGLIERVSSNGHQAVANLLMWQAFGTEIAGAAFKWPTVSLATGSTRLSVQEIQQRKRMQREMKSSTTKRNGSGAGTSEKRFSYRLPFRSRNS